MEEKELIRKSRNGDMAAFEELLLLHRNKIFAHCLQLTKDESAAEDLTQEACLKALHNLPGFKEHAAFGTWLWRIAHNLCLDYLRKQNHHPTISLEEEKTKAQDVDGSVIQDCLEHLPLKQREVFELFYVQKLSQKEIAKKINVPHGTVRSRLHYAKKKLRKFFS
ncbi:MAG: RNA polymerase sigma factor [Verrucomicrobia bacterium]|nr:RNA polymerase sigma factor [Verrucomicrobiota bacterium]MBS0646673.1 RNA polymerase sigma factor [Verrucomicrobiota bacterium]